MTRAQGRKEYRSLTINMWIWPKTEFESHFFRKQSFCIMIFQPKGNILNRSYPSQGQKSKSRSINEKVIVPIFWICGSFYSIYFFILNFNSTNIKNKNMVKKILDTGYWGNVQLNNLRYICVCDKIIVVYMVCR